MQVVVSEYVLIVLGVVILWLIRRIWGASRFHRTVIFDYNDGTREVVPARMSDNKLIFTVDSGTYEATKETIGKERKTGHRLAPKTFVDWHVHESNPSVTTYQLSGIEPDEPTKEYLEMMVSHRKYQHFLSNAMAALQDVPKWILVLALAAGMWLQTILSAIMAGAAGG